MLPESHVATALPQERLRGVALASGAIAVLLALLTPVIVASIEGIETQGFPLFNDELSRTQAYVRLAWASRLIGLLAICLACTMYVTSTLGRSGKLALLLGIVALAWKYVILAFVIALVIAILIGFAS